MRDIEIAIDLEAGTSYNLSSAADISQLGTNFHWISPLIAISRDLVSGAVTFLVSTSCGWTGREIVNFLKSHGVEAYTMGSMIVNDTFMIQVAGQDEYMARFWLGEMGLLE
ncbi:MAG: hypothetical protein EHM39_04285 [Chloroflexi bacterium]|nr:MAG: hypothetical protein EHM39_04285 [Chloroflexota bacterium]